MADAIPDLWRAGADATRLYELYLCRLQQHHRHERVAAVCPRIRRYATRGPGSAAGLFTFSFETDSLCELQDYRAAWRRLRRREEIGFGERLDLRNREWSPADGWELANSYAPVLFFLGRYRQGCDLRETSLDFRFGERRDPSFHMLFDVCNGDEVPRHRCRVTLAHFYARLGRDLRQWRHWATFVNGFHPRLFRVASVCRDDLLADSSRLSPFVANLEAARRERTPTGFGGSQSDLIDSDARVRTRQEAIARKLAAFREEVRPTQDRTDQALREWFPELQDLPE